MMYEGSAGSNGRRPKILLVEDDPAVRRSLQLLLSGRGYDVRSYASANALIADASNRNAVCFVADYRMPELDGIAVLRMLREDGWEGRAVLITAYHTPGLARSATEAGFDVILEKPLQRSALADAVSRLVDNGSR